MLPESGGAGYFTLLVADRLADLNREVGRAVTLDELVDAVYETPGVPWTWVGQWHQSYLAHQEIKRCRSRPCAEGPRTADESRPSEEGSRPVTVDDFYDDALGWRYPGFDINRPADRRAALRNVIVRRVTDAQRLARGRRTRQWVIRHDDWTLERNPDPAHQPKVYANGQYHDWTDDTRRQAEQVRTDQVTEINRGSIARSFDQLPPAGKGTVLRFLAERLPRDKSAAVRVTKGGLLDAIGNHVGDDPGAIVRLIHELTSG